VRGNLARILLYGNFKPQDFERCWLKWLQESGYTVSVFERGAAVRRLCRYRLADRVLRRLAPPLLAWYESRSFVETACKFQPDLVVVVCGNLLTGEALDEIRAETSATLFHFHNEDFLNTRSTSRCMQDAAPHYDQCFTTKSFNVREMGKRGINRVTYVPHGYRNHCHFPVAVSRAELRRYGSSVVFVGTWEPPRAEILEHLEGYDLRIWGNFWERLPRRSWLRHHVEGRAVYCAELSRVFNASEICLAFLRKVNRDRHTSRTFEIPACGGFQVSERTDEVLTFFEEGKEIECFSSEEELKDKITYYLAHDTQRRRIAAAGFERVRRSHYSFTDRLQTLLEHYFRLRSQ